MKTACLTIGLLLLSTAPAATQSPDGNRQGSRNVEGCTAAVIAGFASEDGRPILWKNRDVSPSEPYTRVFYVPGLIDYIGVGSSFPMMGLNRAGLALGNTLLSDLGVEPPIDNFSVQDFLLRNVSSVLECEAVLRAETSGTGDFYPGSPSMTLPVIDGYGTSRFYELGPGVLFVYDPLRYAPDEVRNEALVVRANQSHQNPSGLDDEMTGGNRYYEARENLERAVRHDGIGPDDPPGGKGITISEMIHAARFGEPGGTIYRNSNINTTGVLIAHGVKQGEDPRIAQVWLALGNPDYSPFFPLWVEQGRLDDMPSQITTSGEEGLSFQARRLFESRVGADYDLHVNRRFEPIEANLLEAVGAARARWLVNGYSYAEARRISLGAIEAGFRTLRTLAELAHSSPLFLNETPLIASVRVEGGGLRRSFVQRSIDPDGTIASVFWDFGDGSTSRDPSPVHAYSQPGCYLVECFVVDNLGSCNVRWSYVDAKRPSSRKKRTAP